MKKSINGIILCISWVLNAQVALPTFQAVQYAGESALYSFSSHTFTNCGKTGYSGPTLAECKSSYDVSWEDDTDFFDVPSNAGIQLWTVPETATYRIEVWGAQGAFINSGHNYDQVVQGGGGKGARMRGDFNLTAGDKIKILVGQMGRGGYAASGGGGGTFVATANNTALIVAGGGGGNRQGNTYNNAMDAVTGTSGVDGVGSGAGDGGSNGQGGAAGQHSGSGAGFSGDGIKSSDTRNMYIDPTKSYSFVNGGLGGRLQYASNGSYMQGGFGGGGAGGWGGTGAGGGYSGGGGGINSNSSYAGGGGSYNNGSNQSNTGALWENHGKCTITKQ